MRGNAEHGARSGKWKTLISRLPAPCSLARFLRHQVLSSTHFCQLYWAIDIARRRRCFRLFRSESVRGNGFSDIPGGS
jgi:hypothetical protein